MESNKNSNVSLHNKDEKPVLKVDNTVNSNKNSINDENIRNEEKKKTKIWKI